MLVALAADHNSFCSSVALALKLVPESVSQESAPVLLDALRIRILDGVRLDGYREPEINLYTHYRNNPRLNKYVLGSGVWSNCRHKPHYLFSFNGIFLFIVIKPHKGVAQPLHAKKPFFRRIAEVPIFKSRHNKSRT
jgi:hypothetical protein